MKLVMPVAAFDWDGFLEETLKNLEHLIPEENLVIKQVDKHVEYYSKRREGAELLEEMRAKNTCLFVHFAVDNLDNAVILADGSTKLYVDPNVVSPEDEDAYETALESAREHLYCSETETVGFIFERHGDQLTITTGWYSGGAGSSPPAIDRLVNNEELDFYGYAMERYIEQFILS